MDFGIYTVTAGTKVYDLVVELRRNLDVKINNKYKEHNITITIVIRCLPKSYNRRSFTRYEKVENHLGIDFCVIEEEYEKKYKIEQRFELGILFLQWLEKGLSNKNLLKNNPNFDTKEFISYIKSLGEEIGWFSDEIDWSLDLDS